MLVSDGHLMFILATLDILTYLDYVQMSTRKAKSKEGLPVVSQLDFSLHEAP